MRSFVILFGVGLVAACSAFDGDDPGTGPAVGADGGAGNEGGVVDGEPADTSFLLEPITATAPLVQGGDLSIPITIKRGKQLQDPVVVSVKGLRAGVTAAPLSITGTTGILVLTASATAPQGPAPDASVEAVSPKTTLATPLKTFVRGQPGAADTSFGTGGRTDGVFGAPGNFAGGFQDLVLGSDDSVYGVGSCFDGGGAQKTCAFHLDANGAIDTAYGTNGVAMLGNSDPTAAAVTSDGRLVVTAGRGTGLGTLGRFDPGGKPDSTFGMGAVGPGTAYFSTTGGLNGTNEGPVGVSVRKSDGHLFVAWVNFSGSYLNGSMHLDATGSLVSTYGVSGGARSATAAWGAIAVRNDGSAADGNLITAWVGTNVIGYLQVNGDTSTTDPGQAMGPTPRTKTLANVTVPADNVPGLVLLADGSAVVPVSQGNSFYLRRVTRTGDDAPGWGTAGLVGPLAAGGAVSGIAAQADGKILVAVDHGASGAGPVEILRLTASGALDTDFGAQGRVKETPGASCRGRKVLVQKSGRVVMGGETLGATKTASVYAYWP